MKENGEVNESDLFATLGGLGSFILVSICLQNNYFMKKLCQRKIQNV